MSIKTKYANKIFEGTKIFEYRRKNIDDKYLIEELERNCYLKKTI